jgi:hypothetical protein
VKFRSVKSALGYYAARRRGPELAQVRHGDRVQADTRAGDEWITIGATLYAPEPEGVGLTRDQGDRLLSWATRSDAAEDLGPIGALIGRVARKMRERGMLRERVQPAPVERVECVDLNTGERIQTTRLT